jgi:hypothetical protein
MTIVKSGPTPLLLAANHPVEAPLGGTLTAEPQVSGDSSQLGEELGAGPIVPAA